MHIRYIADDVGRDLVSCARRVLVPLHATKDSNQGRRLIHVVQYRGLVTTESVTPKMRIQLDTDEPKDIQRNKLFLAKSYALLHAQVKNHWVPV